MGAAWHALMGMGMGGYDSDYQAWLDELTAQTYTHPSAACNQILSDMVAGIKADGNWTLLDRFWFFAHNGDSDGATVDMIDPPGHAQATKVNSPGWTAKEGFNSNGTTSYLNYNYNPFSQGVAFSQNSASLGIWLHTASDGGSVNRVIIGAVNTGVSLITLFDANSGSVSSRFITPNGQSGFTSTPSFESGKSYGITRTGSAAGNNYKQGISTNSWTYVSITLTNSPFFGLSQSNSGTPVSFCPSDWKLSVSWFGSGNVNQLEMHNRISTAMTAIALL